MPFAGLGFPIGIWALSALVPLIILYLIRNKPKEITVPSLMFLMKDKGYMQKFSFLQKFMRNLLFIIQLLLILLLSLSIASPMINLPYDATSERTVIVIDTSGSMSAKSDSSTRFERAVSKAKEEISGDVSIILAQEVPLVVLENGKRSGALDVLAKISSKATKTNIQDSMLLALDLLKGEKGTVVVISDFIVDANDDIGVAYRTISAKGNRVKFIDVKGEKKNGNIGITRLDVTKKETKVFVKNFNEKMVEVDALVQKDNELLDKKTLTIHPYSVESISFSTIPGISTVEIDANDDLPLDNSVTISNPEKKAIDVLLITNNADTSLRLALESSENLHLETVELPVVPKFNQDVIIMDKFSRELLLPGTFEDVSGFVKNGGVFIITSQEDIDRVDFSKLDFIKIKSKHPESSVACIDFINEVTRQFDTNRCFAKVSNYFSIEMKNDSVSFASAEDKTPLIIGKGRMLFYNIDDDYSDFNTLPSYPIFWDEMIRYLVGEENINEFNVQTGTIKVIDEQNIQTPSGSFLTTKVIFDQVGVYKIGDKTIVANMLDEQESDIYRSSFNLLEEQEQMQVKPYRTREDFNLEMPLIALGLLFVWIELLYIKTRGDL